MQQYFFLGLARIEQRTAFVTSTYREKLQQAIDFRNRFAECPYLSLCLINRTAILVRLLCVLCVTEYSV